MHQHGTFNTIIFAVFVCCFFSCNKPAKEQGDKVTVKGEIVNYSGEIIVCKVSAGTIVPADTIITDQEGHFFYLVPDLFDVGVYVFKWGTSGHKRVSLIFDNEDITFTATNNVPAKVSFSDSPQNDFFLKYRVERDITLRKLRALGQTLQFYPLDNSFYPKIQRQFKVLQDEHHAMINKYVKEYPNTFLAKYLLSDQYPILYPAPTIKEQNIQWHKDWLTNIRFNDPGLLNSSLFPDKLNYYINLSQIASESPFEAQARLLESIEKILDLSKADPQVYDFCVNLLLKQLKDSPFEILKEKILKDYNDFKVCNTSYISDEVEKAIALEPGNFAPSLDTLIKDDECISLYDLDSRKTLIIFWSATCDHCKYLLRDLEKWYLLSLNKKLNIVTVCLDEDDPKGYNKNWYYMPGNTDQKKQTAKRFRVTSTPCMYLLDSNKRIINLPRSIFDIQNVFTENNEQ